MEHTLNLEDCLPSWRLSKVATNTIRLNMLKFVAYQRYRVSRVLLRGNVGFRVVTNNIKEKRNPKNG
jgi:hypothetical protein